MEVKRNLYSVREILSIKDMIYQSAEFFGDKEAFLVKSQKGGEYNEITYKRFLDDINGLGTMLLSMGLKNKKIGIMGVNSYQWIVANLATICGVGISVPFDKELSKEEVVNLVEKSQCEIVFVSSKFKKYFENTSVKAIYIMDMYENQPVEPDASHIVNLIKAGRKMVEKGCDDYISAQVLGDDIAQILYTSGTTGNPKGVMLSHKNLCRVIMSTSMIVSIKPEDRTLSLLPIHHTFESTLGIMTTLFNGGSIAFCEGLKYIIKNLVEAKVTILVAVPLIVETIYKKIWKEAEKSGKRKKLEKLIDFNKSLTKFGIHKEKILFRSLINKLGGRLRLIICGAAALNPNVSKGFYDIGIKVLQGYGLTETAPLSVGTPDFVDIYKKPGSCGPVIPGVEIKIENKGEDGIGEIYLKGDNVMVGYHNMPEETEAVLQDGWFKTGDLGFLDNEQWLYITGRSKNVIVTKTGKNIYPEEIEALVNNLELVKDSMVYGLQEEVGGDYTVAIQIIPELEKMNVEENEVSDESLYDIFKEEIYKINKSLPSYKRIKHITIRKEDFIRTTTKKIKRQENI